MLEANQIGFQTSSNGDSHTVGMDPSTNEVLPGKFSNANNDEINFAVDQASEAFEISKNLSGAEKANFLNTIADEIMNLGDQLISRCCAESGLPEIRIKGERGRTIAQLQMFANLVNDGSWVEATIERAMPNRDPIPKPDIRRTLIPLGPVVVFAASNFPLAFSVAGGDTASALAAGNPVIVKAHRSHPGTSSLIASAIVNAAKKAGMPDGIFSLLHGEGSIVGQGLIKHSKVKAGAFTGSQKAGMLLYELANQRKEPIPFFAEMGSVNPVLLLPSGLNSTTAKMLSESITMGVGQFCTNPGLIFAINSDELNNFISELANELIQIEPGVMLNKQICASYDKEINELLNYQEVSIEGRSEKSKIINSGRPTLASMSASAFINNLRFTQEVFGPYSLIIRCNEQSEIDEVLNKLDGQLTGSIIGEISDFKLFQSSIDIMKKKVGRIIYNGVPTGVEVCSSMQHGGPFPASSDSRFTSVGTAAIKRFVRPITFQSWPYDQLPDELKDDNPLKIWRYVDGKLTKD